MELRILVFAFLAASAVSSPVPSKQYRHDYEYSKNTDAFYKLHIEGASKYDALGKCTEEGAELVKITSDEDLKQVLAMMKKLSDLEDYVMVVSDAISDEPRSDFECNVVNRQGKIEKTTARQELPFVCKVAAKDAPYNKECGVYSNDYESRISTTGSCYRVSTDEATWNEAHAKCQAEGAHLAILSNDKELEVLYNMLKDKPHNSETQYFTGVRADTTTEPRVFKTVLNQTLEEVGYGPWEEGEPNEYEGGENCVALDTRRHGKYNDVWCHVKMPYVCESSGPKQEVSTTPSTTNIVPEVPVPSKQYRPDYEYNKNTDAFYKLHTEGASKYSALDKCVKEGAELVKITSLEDLKQVHAMMKKLSALEDYVMVASGGFQSRVVVNRRGKMQSTLTRQELPFVCKVAAKDAPYDKECGVYSNGYVSKISTTGSCYRVSTDEATWNEAHAACQAEGAHLVILSNDKELEVLHNMLKDKSHNSGTQYFAGVRADTSTDQRVFKTVLNQTLEEVGYGPWDESEPNDYEGGENCVALDTRRHGKYNDVWCHVKMPYVCESSGPKLEIRTTPSTPNIVPEVPVPSKQYRPGYEYNKNTDAFYKLHTEAASKYIASNKCIKEGAELVKITSDEDLKQVHAMMKKLSDLEDYVIVASDEDSGNIHPSYDTKAKVVNRRGKIENTSTRQQLPFVCKVAASDALYDKECDVYSYGSCYRVSIDRATWSEAHAACQAEGAHLAVLNNDKELEVLYNMLKDKPHNSETQYFAGVRADTTTEPRVFKTVFNQTLQEVGYGPWEEGEPNEYEGGENCVALDTRRHGKYNDVWCHVRMHYICESSVAPLEIHATPSTPNSVLADSLTVPSKQYRPDYEYNKNTDAFYKLHTKATSKYYATGKCIEEGAELVKIATDEDLKQVYAMMKKLPDLEDYVMVASDDFKSNVVNRRGKIETTTSRQELPFVCKVAAMTTLYNKECGVYSNDYESRISTTGSCYRVSTEETTWNEAHAKCQAEGAHLAILSNDKELEVLYNMLKNKPHDSETQYFAGVRADTTTEPRIFKTVLNQTLEEVGYGPWEEGEPNEYEGGENCVALDTRRHGKYNDVWCHVKMPYVCESYGAPLEIRATPVPTVPVPSKQYRPDYEYNKNTDAFYKLHTKVAPKYIASNKCNKEGAELVKITSDEDLKQVHAMMKQLSDLEDYVMVASEENSDDFYPSHFTKVKVVNRRGKIENTNMHQQLPFVCKVAASDAPYNKECDVYSNDYESKMSITGSCYRVSTKQATWNQAHAACQAEGAHLVILSNDKELEVLYNMLKDKPHNSETQYFAGVRADTTTEPRVFKTVLNQTLEEVGYGPWEEGEPNEYEGGENCVALDTRRHGKYNDVWCHVRMHYICESSGPKQEISTIPNTPISESAFKRIASRICTEQGTELLKIITSDEDVKQVHAMMEKLLESKGYVSVTLKENGNEYTPYYKFNVLNGHGKIEKTPAHQELSFVCKTADKGAPYNEECGVYSNDYESKNSTTGSCYRVSTDEATWDEAHAACQAEGAHLVILSSDKELEVLYNMLKDKPHNSETQYFAGVRADTTTQPHVFKTVLNQTLEEVGYGPWDEGEPNDWRTSGEYCVALDTRRHGKYNDVWCHVRMPYVCESSGPKQEVSTTPSTPISEGVWPIPKQYRPDYEYNRNTDAFYKLHKKAARQTSASIQCIKEGAELVKITSDDVLKQVHAMMVDLSDLEDYMMVAPDENSDDFYPSYDAKAKVVNRRGKVEYTTNRQELPFVCKVAAKDAPYNKECGVYSNDYASRISTTGSCYRISTDEVTWSEAHAACQAEGAHLVILSNDKELEVLYNMLKDKPHNSETQYFAGVRADTTTDPRVFKTVLNQTLVEVGYGPWDESEPNNYEGGENCVALDTRRHGKYNDVWCHVKMPYVCESSGPKPEISVTPSGGDPSSPDSKNDLNTELLLLYNMVDKGAPYNAECGVYSNDYESKISTTGSCYRVSTDEATWDEAHAKCQAEGAHLVILSSDKELEVLYNMLKDKPHNSETQYFAGVRADTATEPRVFKTVLNQTLEEVGYGPWDENEPNDYHGGENCVALDTRRHGKYNDVWCHIKMPYVCESSGPKQEVSTTSSTTSRVPTMPVPYKPYRADYEYNSYTDAFYKLHTEGAYKTFASTKCNEEGAELVQITSDEDLKQVHAMMKKLPDVEDYVMVAYKPSFDRYSSIYKTDVVNRRGGIERTTYHQKLPFVCKVAAKDKPYDVGCDVYSNDYVSKISTTGSCYRVSTEEATWNEAYNICKAEGAHLVVLESDEELEFLYNMLKDKPHNSETQYFAGVRADTTTEPRVFKTVLHDTLEEAGYGPWEESEPNNYEGGENCVALDTRRHGKYNDVWCHVKMPYVCESYVYPPEFRSTTSSSDSEPDPVSSTVPPMLYRPDYEYNENTDAFYKLHTKAARKLHAFNKCMEEGAELLYITSDEDVKQVQAMIEQFPGLQDAVMVQSGSASVITDEFMSMNECNEVNCRGKIEVFGPPWKELPFVCKVAAQDAHHNEECRVNSIGYESRISTTGSCYRISTDEVTWSEAHAACQAEGAHLVILSNDKELEVLYNMLKDKPHNSETQYFAGVRADTTTEPRVFKTVFNETLEEVGYGPWDESEPNDYEGGENCVALDTRRHGKYNDVWCHVRMPYVCESSVLKLEISATPSTSNNDAQIPDTASSPVTPKQYRLDYEYNKNTDASYKLHTDRSTKMAASDKCTEEGAELIEITSDEDLKQVLAMIKFLDVKESVIIASTVTSGQLPSSKCSVVNARGEIAAVSAYEDLPFVCKVAASAAPYNKECDVYSNGYESRMSTTGSCYRISTEKATWNDAYANCRAEGAHLVILSNDQELDVLNKMLKDKPHDSETQYYAGVRADMKTEPRVFKTVLNQTLEEVGYGPWDESEPNDYEGGENCVALDTRRHGKYNDVWCHVRMPYVCESSGPKPATKSSPNNDTVKRGLTFSANVMQTLNFFFSTPYFFN